jgi:hypothetical protein
MTQQDVQAIQQAEAAKEAAADAAAANKKQKGYQAYQRANLVGPPYKRFNLVGPPYQEGDLVGPPDTRSGGERAVSQTPPEVCGPPAPPPPTVASEHIQNAALSVVQKMMDMGAWDYTTISSTVFTTVMLDQESKGVFTSDEYNDVEVAVKAYLE